MNYRMTDIILEVYVIYTKKNGIYIAGFFPHDVHTGRSRLGLESGTGVWRLALKPFSMLAQHAVNTIFRFSTLYLIC